MGDLHEVMNKYLPEREIQENIYTYRSICQAKGEREAGS